MTRDDAIALLEMMRREQRSQSSVPPLRSDAIAKRYVNIMSQLLGGSRLELRTRHARQRPAAGLLS